jgi:hypothetical protein
MGAVVILHLGVHDMAYAAQFHSKASPSTSAQKAKRGMSAAHASTRAQQAYGKGMTTGEVAGILEAKYHLMETFWSMNRQTIAASIQQSIGGAITNVINGQPGPILLTAQAISDIETAFKQALSARAFDGRIAGVPTQASLAGVSHRFKQPYAKRGSRPSFIDTGALQSSFAVWVDPSTSAQGGTAAQTIPLDVHLSAGFARAA